MRAEKPARRGWFGLWRLEGTWKDKENTEQYSRRGAVEERKEKRPRGSITGKQAANQCGQNERFGDGQGEAGAGEEAGLSGPAWRWNPTIYKEDMVTKGVGKRRVWNGRRLLERRAGQVAETGQLELEQAQGFRQRRSWLPGGRAEMLTPKDSAEAEREQRARGWRKGGSDRDEMSGGMWRSPRRAKREKLGCGARNQSSATILITILSALNLQPDQSTLKTLFYRYTKTGKMLKFIVAF